VRCSGLDAFLLRQGQTIGTHRPHWRLGRTSTCTARVVHSCPSMWEEIRSCIRWTSRNWTLVRVGNWTIIPFPSGLDEMAPRKRNDDGLTPVQLAWKITCIYPLLLSITGMRKAIVVVAVDLELVQATPVCSCHWSDALPGRRIRCIILLASRL
jgi:hypothetical protein